MRAVDGHDDFGEGAAETVFRDVIFLALVGFIAMVIMLLPHIKKESEEEAKDHKAPGQVIVEMQWPPNMPYDVDLWVKAPGEQPVDLLARLPSGVDHPEVAGLAHAPQLLGEVGVGRDDGGAHRILDPHTVRVHARERDEKAGKGEQPDERDGVGGRVERKVRIERRHDGCRQGQAAEDEVRRRPE